jgi:hypothetical protein
MKESLLVKCGKFLMKKGKLRVCIIDDQETYFSENMLKLVRAAGFTHIERHYLVDEKLLKNLLENPPEIVILDIKGVAAPSVAKDGFGIAKTLYVKTDSYIVITSAHQFFLSDTHKSYDYMIKQRILTAVDFIEELTTIVENYLRAKSKFYQKIVFRVGFALARVSLSNGTA